MKRKDLIYLVVAVAILLVAGYIVYSQLLPKKSSVSKKTQIEVVGPISPQIDSSALGQVTNESTAVDYTIQVDTLPAGNTALFGR